MDVLYGTRTNCDYWQQSFFKVIETTKALQKQGVKIRIIGDGKTSIKDLLPEIKIRRKRGEISPDTFVQLWGHGGKNIPQNSLKPCLIRICNQDIKH